MTNFIRRTLTGSGLVTVILAAVWFGPYSFAALVLLIAMLCLREFYQLLEIPGARPAPGWGILLATSLILTCFAAASGLFSWKWLLINVPVAFGVFVAELYRRRAKFPFESLALTFLGITATALPLCFFIALPFLSAQAGYHFELPMGCFLLLWANDTAAYLVGRKLGRQPLFRRISPKKTWEGSFGGAVAALVTASFLSRYFTVLSTTEWEILSFIIVVTGTYGDLLKSMLKRSRGVKDSGTILPGHGGMLDRFDSLLGSAPFICVFVILLER
ncbi:phosphatidate cytidylyltransferase [Mucilaginibacter sp. UR6-11]|uniref:phosphatidate cytidylyltransferase n=1 Tax=Mucilaginibacter sp. UR6-11 TaxID=1435644 RepID=UPI001E52F04F|nr:phosphatidate cytidylyltransferase [Mucilaginibacter sp. UR6-11]MCC8425507.1 phosphatidate cytidylyltransferase [Mucilaginibacter sp. UR6-11]